MSHADSACQFALDPCTNEASSSAFDAAGNCAAQSIAVQVQIVHTEQLANALRDAAVQRIGVQVPETQIPM